MKSTNRLIYIMYAEDDTESLIKFYNHLSPLKQTGVDIWHKGLIKPGEDVRLVDEDKIAKSSLVLLLISVNFINKNNGKVQELLDKKVPIVPIILNECLWNITNIKHFKVLPSNGVAINNWENFDIACTNVAESIGALEREMSLNGTESVNKDMESTRIWLQDQVLMHQNMQGIKSKKEFPLKDIGYLTFIAVLWAFLILVVSPYFAKVNADILFVNIFATIITLDYFLSMVIKYTMTEIAREALEFDRARIAYYIFYFGIAFGIWGPPIHGRNVLSFFIMIFAIGVFVFLYINNKNI